MTFLRLLYIFIALLMIPQICFAKKCKYAFILESKDDFHPVLTRSIDIFHLPVRARDALKSQEIHYIGDVITKTETDLTRVSHIKKEDINTIKAFLSQMDLRLGTDINWPSHNREKVEALVKKLNPKIELTPVFARSIDTLELLSRAIGFLNAKEIYYLGDLVKKTEIDLIIWQMEKKDIIAIMDALAKIDLRLGLNIEWPADREQVEILVQKLNPKDEPPSAPYEHEEKWILPEQGIAF